MNQFSAPNLEKVMKYIGGKWKTIIIASLLSGEKRFNELKNNISSITQRALSMQLKELEEDGLLIKKEISNLPGKFTYQLTELGKSLNVAISELSKWSQLKI